MSVLPVRPVPPDHERMAYVLKNLRQRDRDEIYALRWNDDPDQLLSAVMAYAGRMAVIWERNETPVAAQGVYPLRPGVWCVWCFGTDAWSSVLLSMTKHADRFIMPALMKAKFHRAEAHTLSAHTDARRWIESLGAQRESTQRGAGRAGEDFTTYVWTPDDVLLRWRRRAFWRTATGNV